MTLPYVGGKFYHATKIIKLFPPYYWKVYTNYIEPFGGGAWVLFKKKPNKREVYNDINGELVNLFHQIRDNFQEFKRKAEWTLYSRKEWEDAHNLSNDKTLRAVQYAFLICSSRNFRFDLFRGSKGSSFNWYAFKNRLEQIKDRFQKVIVENLDFETCIKRYDSEKSLFYVDPPYDLQTKLNKYYPNTWTKEDTIRLAETLKNIKGTFYLSNYPTPLIKKLFKGYKFFYIKHTLCVSDLRENKQEVIITNYYKKGGSIQLTL